MNSFQSEPFTLKLLTEFENREEASGGQFKIQNSKFKIYYHGNHLQNHQSEEPQGRREQDLLPRRSGEDQQL